MRSLTYCTFLSIITVAHCLSSAGWRAQSIYQVMTDRFARTDGSTTASCDLNNYCGGTWKGLINHLDYIQDMGFTAVWISPVVKNLPDSTGDGSSYHGYWAQDIYSVNTNFGSAADLISLSDELHKRGMYLMVDVVTNHMGYAGCGDCVDYSKFNPFNKESYYHPFCLIDYNNRTSMELCWEGDNVVSLPDLRTEDSTVQDMWETWIKQLVSNYTIDGLRIDSAAEVNMDSLSQIESAAGVYAIGEVFNSQPNFVCPYQEHISGTMNYPAYYWITSAFGSTNGNIKDLENGINTMKDSCSDTTLLGSFLENQDNPRFASVTSDMSLAKNAIGFQILADGIPVLYQGQEQHLSGASTPDNREALWKSGYSTSSTLYGHIGKLNAIRKQAIAKDDGYLTYKAHPVWTDDHTIIMRKGFNDTQVIGVFNNLGSSGSASFDLLATSSGFDAGLEVTEVLSCEKHTTDASGNLAVSIKDGAPLILYSTFQLSGSGLCGS